MPSSSMDDGIGTPGWSIADAEDAQKFGAQQYRPASARLLSAKPVARRALAHELLKRAVDIVGALTLAVVFSPVWLIVTYSLAIDGGGIFFGHGRIGRNGRAFTVYKFRTMVPDAESVLPDLIASDPALREEWLRDHKLKNDPRVTNIGRFLRKTSLDELPQLLNVLAGEMSLVGPRPIVRGELARYGRYCSYYLAIKPGLTGLWQVSGRNDVNYRRRVAIDRFYAVRSTLLMDLGVLLKTVRVVLGGQGAY